MNLLDVIIIIIILLAVARGVQIGLVQGVFSLSGILLGLFLGLVSAPWVMNYFKDPLMRFIVLLSIVGIIALIFDTASELFGRKVSSKITKPGVVKANAITGGVFGIVVVLILVWLGSAMLSSSPYKRLNSQIQNSAIIQALNKTLPSAPPFVARINSLVTPLDFPQFFVGPAPKLGEPVAPAGSATVTSAVKTAGRSTVRIESLGCGGRLLGSGWVAGDRLVMTNAHVVGGSHDIEVVDVEGRHDARLVYFSPDLDVAVLKVSDELAGKPLAVSGNIADRGVEAVILGFPGGGDFRAGPAAIARQMNSRGLNIYGNRTITRSIYELQGHVEQGNSGGPVVNGDGLVLGMIFAAAQDGSDTAYAITSPQLRSIIAESANRSGSVSTQRCSE